MSPYLSDLYKLALPVCAKKLGAIKPQAFPLSAHALIGSIKRKLIAPINAAIVSHDVAHMLSMCV